MFQIISYDIICLLYYGMRVRALHCVHDILRDDPIFNLDANTPREKIVEYLVYQSQKLTSTDHTTIEPSAHENL